MSKKVAYVMAAERWDFYGFLSVKLQKPPRLRNFASLRAHVSQVAYACARAASRHALRRCEGAMSRGPWEGSVLPVHSSEKRVRNTHSLHAGIASRMTVSRAPQLPLAPVTLDPLPTRISESIHRRHGTTTHGPKHGRSRGALNHRMRAATRWLTFGCQHRQ